MPKAIFNLNEFKTQVLGSNVARTERFETQITFPGQIIQTEKDRTMSLMCEECNIPGLSALVKPHRINNWTYYRTTNLDFLGTEAVFTFVEKDNWLVRSRLEEWLTHMVNPETKEVKFPQDIEGEIRINTLDVQDNIVASWLLKGAIPKIINIQPLAHNSPGVLRTTATFSFTNWESETYTAVSSS